ncbi:MAG: pitrilysin family protein [candidate division Zixibacteria bacterium]|nr:pitrilysin family protein [candidate division Zixibacteria bacterium]
MKSGVRYNKSTIGNGLRVVTEQIPFTHSIAIGVWIDVGSRDEEKDENGISHFIEHMLFKGTKTRSAEKIASSLESLGGSLNAFTSKEQTCFHAVVLDEHLVQAVDILSDILIHSTLSPLNLEREKSVVVEEIVEIEEIPSEYIHELFSGCFWRGHPLGWSIMGSEKVVRSFSRRQLSSYINRHYQAGRIVIAAAGNISHKKLVALLGHRFSFGPGNHGGGEPPAKVNSFLLKSFKNKSNQTHLCLGFPGVRFNHPDRNTLLALHAYLGAGMSSVLFQKVREEKGIAYTIYTFLDFYRDSGVFGAYFAADHSRLHQAMEIILKELKKLKHRKIPSSKFDQIKAQLKGNMTLSMESTMSRMSRLGRHELMMGKYSSLEESLKAIDRLKADNLTEAAGHIFNHQNMTVTSLGPIKEGNLNSVDWSII